MGGFALAHMPDAGESAMAAIVQSCRGRTLVVLLQAFLNDPDLLFVRPIPPPAKIVGTENLNGWNDCGAAVL